MVYLNIYAPKCSLEQPNSSYITHFWCRIYGAEAWTLTDSDDEKMLDLFERKVLRMMYGPVCIEGEWRTRCNHELYLLYGEKKIFKHTSVISGANLET